MADQEQKGPFRLMTVNTAPERAYRLIGRMVEGLKDKYNIEHVGNVTAIEDVSRKMEEVRPNVVFSASMWTEEQAEQIAEKARLTDTNVKTFAIPHGMQVNKGPDYVVDWLIEHVPALLEEATK